MECRTKAPCKFRTKLGFKQYDVISINEQSMSTKTMGLFEGENI